MTKSPSISVNNQNTQKDKQVMKKKSLGLDGVGAKIVGAANNCSSLQTSTSNMNQLAVQNSPEQNYRTS